LVIDRVILTHESERRRVVEVLALALHLQVGAGQQRDRLATAIASLLAAAHAALGRLERALCTAIPAGVEDARPVRRGSEGFQAKINPDLLAGGQERLYGHVGTREANIPAGRLPRDRDRLGGAVNGAGPAHCNPTDFRQDQKAVVEASAVTELLVGKTVVAGAPVEAGIPRRLPRADTAEERLKGFIQPSQPVLEHMRVN